MRLKNEDLEKRNDEINKRAKEISNELQRMKEDFNILININNSFSRENEDLKKRLNESSSKDQESGNKKRKGKEVVRGNYESIDEESEKDEKGARVCQILLTVAFMTILLILPSLQIFY